PRRWPSPYPDPCPYPWPPTPLSRPAAECHRHCSSFAERKLRSKGAATGQRERGASLSFHRDRLALHHDIIDVLNGRRIDQRVSLDCNQVGGLAGVESARLIGDAEQVG